MYHSVTFGTKNTWKDWKIVPSTRPVINPPPVKTQYVDIPGGNGSLDLTESLIGRAAYGNRTGSIEFIVADQDTPWVDIYQDIMNYVHGRRMTLVLEDDPDHYYTGRFAVNAWKSNKDWSRITIDYNLGPYKYPFVGAAVVTQLKELPDEDPPIHITYTYSDYGMIPIQPTFMLSTITGEGATLQFVNEDLGIDRTVHLDEGISEFPDMLFSGEEVSVYVRIPPSTNKILDSNGDWVLDSNGMPIGDTNAGTLTVSWGKVAVL